VTGSAGEVLDVYPPGVGDPDDDLAFEEVLLKRAAEGRLGAVTWSWPGPLVVLGYSQPASDVRLEWCAARSIPVLRRITGGTGVVYQSDLAVSLALPIDHPWARGVHALYERFLAALATGLRSCGAEVSPLPEPGRARRDRSPICFEDQLADTLIANGRKAVGCAQARRRRAVLIHAAVLLDLDPALYAAVFGVPPERVARALGGVGASEPLDVVAASVLSAVAESLSLPAVDRPRPELSDELRHRWSTERWAPLVPARDR
jgi:lipoate-protein ligase A